MQRDWDLIRTILLTMKQNPNVNCGLRSDKIDGYEPKFVAYHFQQMEELGLIKIIDLSTFDTGRNYIAQEITFKGHDLLEKITNETIWEKIKSTAKEQAIPLSVSVISGLAVEYIKTKLKIS